MINFVLNNNFFSYKGNYFIQTFGCAMGSKLSPIISQYIMDYLLDQCLPKLTYKIDFIKKFVDDIILSIPENGNAEILEVFNNFNEHIKFTIEKEKNSSVPFLDSLVIRTNQNLIKLDWFRKETSSGRYINYNSHHKMSIKINFIKEMKHRIEKICHEDYLNKNLEILENLLIQNSYPKSMIRKILYTQNSRAFNNTINQNTNSTQNLMNYASLPYYSNLTDKIIKIFKAENIVVARKTIKSVEKVFSKLKDKTKLLNNSNVVYEIKCLTCEKVYLGQTSQNLRNRISLHKSDIKGNKQRCALTTHVIDNTPPHKMDFDNIKILDKEQNLCKRSFLEMVYIYKKQNNINKKTDIQNLSIIYSYLLSYNPHKDPVV